MGIIRELPYTETPEHRMETVGQQGLSDVELLSLIIRTGTKDKDSFEIAQAVLTKYGGWSGLINTSVETLCQNEGIGKAKATAIKAAIEIGRRMIVVQFAKRKAIRSPKDIAELLMIEMSHLEREELRVVLLDTKNGMQAMVTIYVGSINSSLIRVGEIFKPAIEKTSAAIIIAHNHPSGDPTPSPQDVMVTREIISAGKLLDIEVQDHHRWP